jgi:mono/diheme cytochrome c family protein
MSTLTEEGIGTVASPRRETASQKIATPRPSWGILMVSAALLFGVVMLFSAPTLYVKLVQSHTPKPDAAPVITAGGAPVDMAALSRGKALFAQGCNACHGDNARGRPGLGKDLAHSAFIKSQADAQMVAFLKRGRDISDPLNTTKVPMPPKGGNPALNDKQLVDLVAFLRGLQAD